MKPDYRVFANDSDITESIKNRVTSITITDEIGTQSDACTIELADPLEEVSPPPQGAVLRVYLGYENQIRDMGSYFVDSVEVSGPPDKIKIEAKASPFVDSQAGGVTALQTRKTRSFPNPTTISTLVQTIAKEHGMTAEVESSIADIALGHLDQTDQSDIDFLTRSVIDKNVTIKPADKKIIAVPRSQAKRTTGASVPSVHLTKIDVSTWSIKVAQRQRYDKVTTKWHDLSTGEEKKFSFGKESGTVFIDPKLYQNEDQAKRAAQSQGEESARNGVEISIKMAGRSDLFAEGRLTLSGFRSVINGDWCIKKVTHTINNSGFSTTLDCQAFTEEARSKYEKFS